MFKLNSCWVFFLNVAQTSIDVFFWFLNFQIFKGLIKVEEKYKQTEEFSKLRRSVETSE